tara:strand:+ start:501 stop:1895 length:1395 start_codon:yes stop_codon:yes gene_type:complete
MGIENLIPQAIKLFNKFGKSQRLKAINTLDMLVESGDVGKIRKLPRKVSDGTRSLVAKGKLKDEVHEVLDEVGFVRSDPKISGALGKKYNTEAGKKIIKDNQKKILKDKQQNIDLLPEDQLDAVSQRRKEIPPSERGKKTDKAWQDRRKKDAKILGEPTDDIVGNQRVAMFGDNRRANEALGSPYQLDEIEDIYNVPSRSYQSVIDSKRLLQKAITEGDTESIVALLRSYGASDNQVMASIGHTIPIKDAILIKNKIAPHMTDIEFVQMINNPKTIRSELNLLNTQKKPTERMLYRPDVGWEKKNLKELDSIMQDAQVETKFFTPEGEMTSIGMKGKEVDPEKLRWWINKTMDENTFKGGKKLRLLPHKKILKSMYDLNYSTGGLVKLLDKLKLTKKQRDLILKTAYSPKKKPGTGPKLTRERRVEQKIRDLYGKEKRWKYVKSTVPGPKIKKAAGGILSHYVR